MAARRPTGVASAAMLLPLLAMLLATAAPGCAATRNILEDGDADALAAAAAPSLGAGASRLVKGATAGVTGAQPPRAMRRLVAPPNAPERMPMLAERLPLRGIGTRTTAADGQRAGAVSGAGDTRGVKRSGPSVAAAAAGDVAANAVITPQANGAAGLSFADSCFGGNGAAFGGPSNRVGKLFMRFGGKWFQCSASVINRGLLVTAAHCVHDFGRGAAGYPDKVNGVFQVQFVPGLDGAKKPFGTWTATGILIPKSYEDGSDTCDANAPGIVCNNDIALLAVAKLNNKFIGDIVGWNNYGWNGYGWATPSAAFDVGGPAFALLTQFGYPAAFDRGEVMQVSTSPGYALFAPGANGKTYGNVLKGSSLTGGSSGGPWIVNAGVDAALGSGASYFQQTLRNAVVGVTSWGYTGGGVGMQGSSYFGANAEYPDAAYGTRGAGNIGKLIFDACDNAALPAWNLKAKGACV